MPHWTQTPAGKRKLVRILRKANAAKAGDPAPVAQHNNGNGAILSVDKDGIVTTHVSDIVVWPYDNVGTNAFQLGDVIVKVNRKRIA